MERIRIAFACFVGGAVFTIAALICTPTYWFLGIPAGLISGLLAYSCRTVFWGLLKAFHLADRESFSRFWGGGMVEMRKGIKRVLKDTIEWFQKPHPFRYTGTLLLVPVAFTLSWPELADAFFTSGTVRFPHFIEWTVFVGIVAIIFLLAVNAVALCLLGLAMIGTRSACYSWGDAAVEVELRLQRATYRNAIGLMLHGVLVIVHESVMSLVWRWLYFLILFFYHFVRIIYSRKWALCSIFGTVGGVIHYLAIAESATTLREQFFLVLLGGIFGAAAGLLQWEFISRPLFRAHLREAG